MPSIIMVEDDPMISEIYQKKFESAGFEAVVASSGSDFLNKIQEKKFDLALLDMVLPDMDGINILQEVKKSGKYNPNLKIFIFSNLTDKENYDKAMQNGADGYIVKTQYNPSELVGEVKRLLGEFSEQKKNDEKRNGFAESPDSINREKKKILFIEDERAFSEIFCKKLQDEGYFVELAENGAWGFKEASNKNFDLIITDMVMPAMDGIDIIKKLKLEDKTKNIPIIVLSASSTDEKIKEVMDLGISDFFLKTRVVPSDLSRRVNEILGS